MSRARITLLNLLTVVAALLACIGIALTERAPARAALTHQTDAHEVTDADGTVVPVRSYQRIGSFSPIADVVLLETVAPTRIIGLAGTMRDGLGSHRFEGIRSIDGARVEEVLALNPDLIIVSGMSDAGHVRQLRDAGVQVFRLGEMRGLSTFARDARLVSALVDASGAGAQLATSLERRMRMVAADIPLSRRPRALYLGVMGRGLYGGAQHTSYHDVLIAAGLRDALDHMDGWPELTPEQVLAMDPDVVVLHQGTRGLLCQRDGFATMRACRGLAGTQVVELPSGILNDPGLGMLPCAEQLRTAVHGAPPRIPQSPTEPSDHD
ncbi:MAG: ABC transporter substrate-binding protein [Polyangiales bacterium]|nr:ABC transporter substrate-binding protein [Myxococcales bacterium]